MKRYEEGMEERDVKQVLKEKEEGLVGVCVGGVGLKRRGRTA